MESIQNELSKCYRDQQLIEFIFLQISQLPLQCKPTVKSFRKYVAITVTLPSQTDKYNFKVHPSEVEFAFVLGPSFPFVVPRLHLKTCIISPGFDDCRNLIYEVLGHEWDYKLRLKDVLRRMGEFLSRLGPSRSVYWLARLGQFCMNMVYPVELIKQIRGTQIYYAFEYDSQNVLKMYIADISSTHLVLFLTKQQPSIQKGSIKIPSQQNVTSCMIVFVAELGTITDVLVNRSNYNDIELRFACKKPPTLLSRKLKIRKGQSFLKKLIQNLNNYDLTDIKYEPHTQNLGQEEKICLSSVNEAERELMCKFNKHTIEKLNTAYQKIIEFYSSCNLPFYTVFVEKITILLQRPDVKLILEAERGSLAPTNTSQPCQPHDK